MSRLKSLVLLRIKPKRMQISIILISIILCGILIFQAIPASTDQTSRQEFSYYMDIFMDALSYTRDNYVETDDANYRTLFYGAVKGMIDALGDHHSAFLDPERYGALKQGIEGEFGGIGIHIDQEDGYPIVVAPIEGTPAWEAHLQPRDRIVEVEGEPTKDKPLDEIINKLKGPVGTSVTFKIQRTGMVEPKEITIERARISIPTVRYEMMDDTIAYMRINQFSAHTNETLTAALMELKEQGMKRLIIDLRNNPGGLLEAAVSVCRRFIPEGKVVFTRGRYMWDDDDYYAEPSKIILKDEPIAVLINENSASASEILAGALQDTKRGVVVGTRSYGKGSVQNVYPLRTSVREEIGMRLTVQKYYTPSGRSIHGQGIEPDIEIDFPMRTIDDMLAKLTEDNAIQDFIDNHENPTESDYQEFIKSIKDQNIPVNEDLLRNRIRYWQNRYDVDRLYDLEYDIQLQAAVEAVKNPEWYDRELVKFD